MISDSPYKTSDLPLSPYKGLAAGLVGAGLMLILLSALTAPSSDALKGALIALGTTLTGSKAGETLALPAGAAIHELVGAVLGLLYAVSQQRVSPGGFLVVGFFNGVVIWAVSRFASHLPLLASTRLLVHSKSWFLACELYGVSLAVAAIVANRDRRASEMSEAIPD